MSADNLTWAVEASATQIALEWIVHQWEPALDLSSKTSRPPDLAIQRSGNQWNVCCLPNHAQRDGRTAMAGLFQKAWWAQNTHRHHQML